jgi:hypothetical protein
VTPSGGDAGRQNSDVNWGQKVTDTFNSLGEPFFAASTGGAAAEFAFAGKSLVSGKAASLGVFTLGNSMNEWSIIRGSSSTAGSYSLDRLGKTGKVFGGLAGALGTIISYQLNINSLSDGYISQSEFRAKMTLDTAMLLLALKGGKAGVVLSVVYGLTDIMNSSSNGNVPGTIQLQRDFNNRLDDAANASAYDALNKYNHAKSF